MATITRGEAIRLFKALGCKTSDKWGKKTMHEKIMKVDEFIDAETVIDDETNVILNTVLTAIEDGEEIVVVNKQAEQKPDSNIDVNLAPEEKTYSVFIHPESDSIFVDFDDSQEDDLVYAEVSGLSKEEAEQQKIVIEKEYLKTNVNKDVLMVSDADGVVSDKTPNEIISDLVDSDLEEEHDPPKNIRIEKPESVRILKSRSYYAGVVIRKHGISAGINEAMVNELDKLYKKRNRKESMYRLRLAWHAVYGFCGLSAD